MHRGLQEEGDEPADEAVEEARLGEREAEPLVALNLGAQLGLAGLGLDRGVEHRTNAGASTGRAAAGTDAERDRPTGVLALLDDRFHGQDQWVQHPEKVEKLHYSTTPLFVSGSRPRHRDRWRSGWKR